MDTFSVKDGVTLAIASVGAVLGVINTWKAISKDRPKLRVVPKQAILVDRGAMHSDASGTIGNPNQRPRLCIEVLNLSTFPLTVTEVGVLFRGSTNRGVIFQPVIQNGAKLPLVLEPRRSLTAYADPTMLDKDPHMIKSVYAMTDCGLRFVGKSRALDDLLLQAQLRATV